MMIDDVQNENQASPDLQINGFEGPLSLLLHLIEKNKMDIYDISISEITEQYLSFIEKMKGDKQEIQADFLVMASTLLYIKSAMLLPKKNKENHDEDPRSELVLRLLEYRRSKLLAQNLSERWEDYSGCAERKMLEPSDIGLVMTVPLKPLDTNKFFIACRSLNERNTYRFQDIRDKVVKLLKKDRLPFKQYLKNIFISIKEKGRAFFFELVPFSSDKEEQISGFLAVLELLHMNVISADQEKPFDVIQIEYNEDSSDEEVYSFISGRDEEYVT